MNETTARIIERLVNDGYRVVIEPVTEATVDVQYSARIGVIYVTVERADMTVKAQGMTIHGALCAVLAISTRFADLLAEVAS